MASSSSNQASKLDASFNGDDVRVVADLFATFTEGDSEQLLSRVLFDEFGRLLEEKFNQFQASKGELKASIEKNFGENMVPKTPRRRNPAALLLERIQRFKMVSFMSEEHSLADSIVEEGAKGIEKEIVVERRVLLKPMAPSASTRPCTTRRGAKQKQVANVAPSAGHKGADKKKVWQQAENPSTPVSSQVASACERQPPSTVGTPHAPTTPSGDGGTIAGAATDPYDMEEGGDVGIEVGASTKSSQPKGRKKKRVPFTPVEKPQASVFAIKKGIRSTARPVVPVGGSTKRVRSSSAAARKKSQQLRKLEEKAKLALKHKEELLKDKAERAKRDREERRLRVEQNNRVKDAEQKERELQVRAQEERLREFRLEQDRLAQQGAAKSPGHHQHHPAQHLNLNRVPSTASSTSSTTAKTHPTSTCVATAAVAVPRKTPTPKQPAHGSMARPAFGMPPVKLVFPSASKLKPVAGSLKLAERALVGESASSSTTSQSQPQPAPMIVATPPQVASTGVDLLRSKLIASAAGSTTPYPHRMDTDPDHGERGGSGHGASRPKSTPKLITPRQIAVPPKKPSKETTTSTPTDRPATAVVVEQAPKRKPPLTARQREAEKLKLEKEMKAVREREEALRQFQRLEEERKSREEERRRAAEEVERLASEKAKQAELESEKRRIAEAVQQAEKELATKREAMLSAVSFGHKNSPFLPPGLAKSLAHVSVVESVDGESTQDADEIMIVATVEKKVVVREVEGEQKSYDGSISDDLTSSITEITPPPTSSNANTDKPATAPTKWKPNGKDERDNKENKGVGASVAGKAPKPDHKFPAPLKSPLKPAVMKQVLNQSTYDMTPDKVFLPSSKENYNVDDLSSNDETDNEDHPRKEVPKWAQRAYLIREQAILRRHLTTQQIANHFGKIQSPHMREIFPQARRKNYDDHSMPLAWSSPLSDPTPGEARFLLFQSGLDANTKE